MTKYLLSVIQPGLHGEKPPDDELQKIMADVGRVDQEMKDAGVWVFAGGLHAPDTATVLRPQSGDVLTTDGPYAEGKEHVGGFWVIKAPDLDAALEWGRKAARACAVPIEVRPFEGVVED